MTHKTARETERFLGVLFGGATSQGQQIGIFTLPDKHTRHFPLADQAAEYALRRAGGAAVYFHVGLAARRHGSRSRCEDIGAIGGLWADIDMSAPWRAEKPLPKTVEEARQVLGRMPFPASIIVHSGYGLHAYWLFKEPWVFKYEEERELAARTARSWHGLVCSEAERLGWEMENLGDLARVLRLPGTYNRKDEKNPVECRILELDLNGRYGPEGFEAYLGKAEASPSSPCLELAGPGAVSTAALERQAMRYLDAMPPAISGNGGHNATYAAATVLVHGFGLQPQRATEILAERYNPRCDPPWSAKDLLHKVEDAATRPHDRPYCWLRRRTDWSDADIAELLAELGVTGLNKDGPRSLGEMVSAYPSLRRPVIHGLLREGEVLNLIAPPKRGKSWLAGDLALAMASGGRWLGAFKCEQGDCLIIDNELHPETSAHRLRTIADARRLSPDAIYGHMHVENLRGRLRDLSAMGEYFKSLDPGRYDLVILDALYRFLPEHADENDNGAMTRMYNLIDGYAAYLRSAFALVHHTSKGAQSNKSVTDVGAGAGAQSRAADTHLILRSHQQEGVVVLDGAARSWPPLSPTCLRWIYPVWEPAPELDSSELYRSGHRRGSCKPEERQWDADSFVRQFITQEPRSKEAILEAALSEKLSARRAGRLLKLAEERGQVHRWTGDKKRTAGFSTDQQPAVEQIELEVGQPGCKRTAVEEMLRTNPQTSSLDISKQLGVSVRYVQKLRRELKGGAK